MGGGGTIHPCPLPLGSHRAHHDKDDGADEVLPLLLDMGQAEAGLRPDRVPGTPPPETKISPTVGSQAESQTMKRCNANQQEKAERCMSYERQRMHRQTGRPLRRFSVIYPALAGMMTKHENGKARAEKKGDKR